MWKAHRAEGELTRPTANPVVVVHVRPSVLPQGGVAPWSVTSVTFVTQLEISLGFGHHRPCLRNRRCFVTGRVQPRGLSVPEERQERLAEKDRGAPEADCDGDTQRRRGRHVC